MVDFNTDHLDLFLNQAPYVLTLRNNSLRIVPLEQTRFFERVAARFGFGPLSLRNIANFIKQNQETIIHDLGDQASEFYSTLGQHCESHNTRSWLKISAVAVAALTIPSTIQEQAETVAITNPETIIAKELSSSQEITAAIDSLEQYLSSHPEKSIAKIKDEIAYANPREHRVNYERTIKNIRNLRPTDLTLLLNHIKGTSAAKPLLNLFSEPRTTDIRDLDSWSPGAVEDLLNEWIAQGSLNVVRFLLSGGITPNLNHVNKAIYLPSKDSAAILKCLLDKTTLYPEKKNQALRNAVKARNWAAITLLIQKGADVNLKIPLEGRGGDWTTILEQAIKTADTETVRGLIQTPGIDLVTKPSSDTTPLEMAIDCGKYDVACILLDNNVSLTTSPWILERTMRSILLTREQKNALASRLRDIMYPQK